MSAKWSKMEQNALQKYKTGFSTCGRMPGHDSQDYLQIF